MSTQIQAGGGVRDDVKLTDDDVAFLLSALRDPSRVNPLTTQQLIDALRNRSGR